MLVAIARHQDVQSLIIKRGGVGTVWRNGIDGQWDDAFLFAVDAHYLCFGQTVDSRVEDNPLVVATPLQAAALVIVPGGRLS